MKQIENAELLTARERRIVERDRLIADQFRALKEAHPQCAPHRLMAAIAAEMEMSLQGVRVSLMRTGSYALRRKEGGA